MKYESKSFNRDFVHQSVNVFDASQMMQVQLGYRIMGYFHIANFRCFVSKTWGLFFSAFNFCSHQHPQKIISILSHENSRVGGTTRLSPDRSTVWIENIWPKYLKCKRIKDSCSLRHKQTKRTYLHSDG